MATKIRKSSGLGVGCLVQLLGAVIVLVGFAFGPIGIAIGLCTGILLVVLGSRMDVRLVCSECRNRIVEPEAKLCPTCHTRFGN